MLYTTLATQNDMLLTHMNQKLSHYSQRHDKEMATFAHHSLGRLEHILDENPIDLLFFDTSEPRYEALLERCSNGKRPMLCIGIGTCRSTLNQSKLFSLGMDDFLTLPMSDELFERRMRTLMSELPQKSMKPVEKKSIEPVVFDEEDLEDLSDLLKELHLHILIMGRATVSEEDLLSMTLIVGKIQSYFMYLVATFPIAHALNELCEVLESDPKRFIELAHELSPLALSFVNDLESWKKEVIIDQTQAADFINASIIANIDMFISFLTSTPDDHVQELDSIFDF